MTINASRRSFLSLSATTGMLIFSNKTLGQKRAHTELVLLGTQGGPNYNLVRGETTSLLLVDGEPYLIDCAYGTMRAVMQAEVNYLDIGNIFLTHLHDDHTADIPALLSHQWTQGRVVKTNIYGPHGTDTLIDAANVFNQANTDIRLVDEDRSVLPSNLFAGSVVASSASPIVVHEDSRVKVSAVENTHYPSAAKARMAHRALSYRFDTQDSSIVFSGDTTYSKNLVNLAKGADILVCEAMQRDVFRRTFDQIVANGGYADNPEGIWKHIIETHSTTEEAGRMAAESGVNLLVLNHLIPGGLQELPDASYVEGVREHFDGEVIVGRDQQRIQR